LTLTNKQKEKRKLTNQKDRNPNEEKFKAVTTRFQQTDSHRAPVCSTTQRIAKGRLKSKRQKK
jgi:hypothetical protein